MPTLRHIAYFLALGLFWGVSPTLYRIWSETGVPVSHVIFITGIGVGTILVALARWRFGQAVLNAQVHRYGFGCAALMNIPFGLSLVLAAHVPPTEMALAISTSPLASYVLALLTGREAATPRRLAAIALGLLSTSLIIFTRSGVQASAFSLWHMAAFSLPILYAFYNWFTARRAPPAADIYSLGAAESFWSGLLALPVVVLLAPPWLPSQPAPWAYWTVAFATLMWIVERIAYFTLIREKGAVYTVQATYVSTPAAVVIASLFFGGGTDHWLWLSLACLMLALYLNNSGRPPLPAPTPQSA